jgi:hypothetical protein
LPTWRTIDPYIVAPVEDSNGDNDDDGGDNDDDDNNDDDDGDDDDDDNGDDDNGGGGIITSCNLWFFNVCGVLLFKGAARANRVQFCAGGRVKSLRWSLPPGVYPP